MVEQIDIKEQERIEKIIKFLEGKCYNIVVGLLLHDQNINMAKIIVIQYILKSGRIGVSINKIAKDLHMDYKNVWRYCKQ